MLILCISVQTCLNDIFKSYFYLRPAFWKFKAIIKKYKCYDKRFQNVLFHASHCSHQKWTGTDCYSCNTGSLLRSLRRTSFSNDNLQRESLNSDRASTQFRRYTDSKSITIALCDSLWYVLASQQQMFRSFFTSGGGRYRPSRLLSGGSGNAQHIV